MPGPPDREQGRDAQPGSSAATTVLDHAARAGGTPAALLMMRAGHLLNPVRSSYAALFNLKRTKTSERREAVAPFAAAGVVLPAPPAVVQRADTGTTALEKVEHHVQVLVAAWEVLEEHTIGKFFSRVQRKGSCCFTAASRPRGGCDQGRAGALVGLVSFRGAALEFI
jgi:hypothetical protein